MSTQRSRILPRHQLLCCSTLKKQNKTKPIFSLMYKNPYLGSAVASDVADVGGTAPAAQRLRTAPTTAAASGCLLQTAENHQLTPRIAKGNLFPQNKHDYLFHLQQVI